MTISELTAILEKLKKEYDGDLNVVIEISSPIGLWQCDFDQHEYDHRTGNIKFTTRNLMFIPEDVK